MIVRKSRIRGKMKASRKTLHDLIRERNEGWAKYICILAHIKKSYGADMVQWIRDAYENRAKEFAEKNEDKINRYFEKHYFK